MHDGSTNIQMAWKYRYDTNGYYETNGYTKVPQTDALKCLKWKHINDVLISACIHF